MSTADDQLRDRIAEAIRTAAYDCDGTCGLTEAECDAQHPIQVAVLHFEQAADVTASITALANVAATAVQPGLDRLRTHVEELQEKLLSFDDNGKCCCSFDDPGDVCLVHSPVVTRLRAERDRLLGFIERGFDTHMQFNIAHPDGTTEQLACADWCNACKLRRAQAERDAARAQVAAAQAALTEPGLHPEQRLRAIRELLDAADPTTT